MLLHLEEVPRDLVFLLSNAREVYAEPDDLLPGLYQLLSYKHVIDYRRDLAVDHNRRTDLMAAYFYDICWDGEGARC